MVIIQWLWAVNEVRTISAELTAWPRRVDVLGFKSVTAVSNSVLPNSLRGGPFMETLGLYIWPAPQFLSKWGRSPRMGNFMERSPDASRGLG